LANHKAVNSKITAKYSYYLVPFKDRRLAAIFNAYDGSFEGFRYFQHPQRYVVNSETIRSRLSKALGAYEAETIEISRPELRYDPELILADRFSPTWEIHAVARDARGVVRKLPISANLAGRVIRGLEELKEIARQKNQSLKKEFQSAKFQGK